MLEKAGQDTRVMQHTTSLYQVDAFTDQLFGGNPAAVCLLNTPRDAAWMQAVAAEMNLSETAFVQQTGSDYELRWFTPTTEVNLCGHATLAAAHVLWEQKLLSLDTQAKFHTRSGMLAACHTEDGIELEFPAVPASPASPPADLLPALGVTRAEVSRSRYDYLVVIDSEDELRMLTPDFQRLCTIDTRGVIVTAHSRQSEHDFVSRFFAPRAGINEDPVTGSAHCTLAPYWARRLGKQRMSAMQASARGGVLSVRLTGTDQVTLVGQAVTVLCGDLHA
jgi:PhzF family phenazine biosynthesis protein